MKLYLLFVAKRYEIFDNRLQKFKPAEKRVKDDIWVIHGVQRPQKRTKICSLIILLLKGQFLASQIIAFHFHTARNVDFDMNILLPVGLNVSVFTSNIKSRALTVNLFGSLALYLDDMNELKCAVVGKMSPLI